MPGVRMVAGLDVDACRRDLERDGYTVFVLPPSTDRDSFIAAARATLPLDPPLESTRSWDALADSLWEGLRQHPAPRIAIVWAGARAMAAADREIALGVLADVTSGPDERGAVKSLVVIVDGGPTSLSSAA
jgi:hypothetical protein